MITIKDNYLSEKEYQTMYDTITASGFPWYFDPYKTSPAEKNDLESFQFIHIFYMGDIKENIISSSFPILKPILSKLKHLTLVRIKLNLNPYSQKLIVGSYHQDQDYKGKAAIYYLNTNNGYTLFKKGNNKVSSVKNRMVFFDTDEYHLGTNSTDCKNRLVLNFNYF